MPETVDNSEIKDFPKLPLVDNRDRHLFSSKIGELFKMDYSAVSQVAKRFE